MLCFINPVGLSTPTPRCSKLPVNVVEVKQDMNLLPYCSSLPVRRISFGFFCLVAVFDLTLLSACQENPSPELRGRVETHLYECSLEERDFPSGWQHMESSTYDITREGIPGNGLGGISAVFGPHNRQRGIPASHGVLAYRTPEKAADVFFRFRLFYDAGRLTPWVSPDVAEAGLSADSFRSGCAYFRSYDADTSTKRCLFLAQYGRFLTTFGTWVSPKYMSEEEMVQVLGALDLRMLQCVDVFGAAVWEEENVE